MSDDLNLKEKIHLSAADDLVIKAARFGVAGWVLAIVLLIVLVVENMILGLSEKQVLATVDGKVVGQVVFNEARLRSDEEVMGDLKKWVEKCTSVNKVSIYEDLAICLNHMSPQMAEERLKDYQKSLYATRIEKYGCTNTDIIFSDKETTLKRKPLDYAAEAILVGEVRCKNPNEKPIGQEFKISAIASLTEKTTYKPLGLQITNSWDILE